MEEHVIICRTNGVIEDVTLTDKPYDFRWYAEQIGTDIIQTVHANGLKQPFLFLCDEEGLLKGQPVINFLGSWLYETHKHGEPIVGDIMIVKDVIRDGEPDIGGMTEDEAEVISEWLEEHFWEAHDQVMATIGHMIEK